MKDIPQDTGYRVLGVSLYGPAPVGVVHVEWTRELLALYGRNGAGKSAILKAFANAATGHADNAANAQPGAFLHIQLTDDPIEWESEYLTTELVQAVAEKTQRELLTPEGMRFHELHGDIGDSWRHWENEVLSSDNPEDTVRASLENLWILRQYKDADSLIAEIVGQRCFTLRATSSGWDVYVSALPSDATHEMNRFLEHLEDLSRQGYGWVGWRLGMGRHNSPMVLAPEGQGYPFIANERPDWVPVPIGYVATISSRFAPDVVMASLEDPDAQTFQQLSVDPKTPPFIVENSGVRALVEMTKEFADSVDQIADIANRTYQGFLFGAPKLRVLRLPPEDWLKGRVLKWEALDRHTTTWVSLSALGAAQKRWAGIAIQWALFQFQPLSGYVALVVDEPEAALHPEAIEYLMQDLAATPPNINGPVLVATHSPQVLGFSMAKRLHVQRGRDGLARVEELPKSMPAELGETATLLGIRPIDVLLLHRVLLVVEGRHDSDVLKAALGPDEWSVARTHMLHMSGSWNLLDVAGSDLLRYTETAIVIALDNVRQQGVPKLWQDVLLSLEQGMKSTEAIRRMDSFERERRDLTVSEGKVLEFCRNAVSSDRPDRFRVFGMSQPDIIMYFDVRTFTKGEVSWESLYDDYQRTRSKRQSFKGWLEAKKVLEVVPTRRNLERLARKQLSDKPPADFVRLLELCREAAGLANTSTVGDNPLG